MLLPCLQTVVGMASRGLRCICLTFTDYPAQDPNRPADFFEDADRVDHNLIAQAIVGIKDPVRRVCSYVVSCRHCRKALNQNVKGQEIVWRQRPYGLCFVGHLGKLGASIVPV